MHLHQLLQTYGYLAIFMVIALENLGAPLPGETILIMAAIYAGEGRGLNIVAIVSTAVVAAFIGSLAGFLIGQYGERHLLHRYRRYLHLHERDLRLGHYLFQRYGGGVVFFARFVVFLRALAGLLAGLNEMDRRRFVLFSSLGAVAWAGTYGTGAYLLGREIEVLSARASVYLGVAAVVITACVFWFLHRHRGRFQREADRAADLA